MGISPIYCFDKFYRTVPRNLFVVLARWYYGVDIVKSNFLKPQPLLNIGNIEINFCFGNAENRTRGSWVRSTNATSVLCSPIPVSRNITFSHDESVRDVRGVVDAKADGQHDVDARQGVDGDEPEVKEPDNVHEGQDNTDLQVGAK